MIRRSETHTRALGTEENTAEMIRHSTRQQDETDPRPQMVQTGLGDAQPQLLFPPRGIDT